VGQDHPGPLEASLLDRLRDRGLDLRLEAVLAIGFSFALNPGANGSASQLSVVNVACPLAVCES
jgi:hypothetical protein